MSNERRRTRRAEQHDKEERAIETETFDNQSKHLLLGVGGVTVRGLDILLALPYLELS